MEDGGKYKSNKFQRWLNRCWTEATDEIKAIKPHILIINGDIVQGVHARDGQLVTNKPEVQAESAIEHLAPIVDAAKKTYFVRGTEWHDGKAAQDVEHIARELGGEKNPDTDRQTWWALFLSLSRAYSIHFSHHIGVTSIPFYEATAPLRDLNALITELYRFYDGRPAVRCLVRSHRHRCVMVGIPPDLWAITTPAWQLATAFAHKKASTSLPQIGYIWLEWDGSELTPHRRTFKLPALRVEQA